MPVELPAPGRETAREQDVVKPDTSREFVNVNELEKRAVEDEKRDHTYERGSRLA